MPGRAADNLSTGTACTHSAHARVAAQVRELDALRTDPPAQRALASTYLRTSRNLEVVLAAIRTIETFDDPGFRSLLHEKFSFCERVPDRNDSGGVVRAAIIRALQPNIQHDDVPLLQRALMSYQMIGLYEVCAELRTAALLALNDLDPELAGLYGARFLTDQQNSNSGEPALSSIRLLAAQQQLGPVFAVASWDKVASFSGGNGEVIGEALRNLVDLPATLIPLLIDRHRESDDEQVLLGLYDLLLTHPAREQWHAEILGFLRTTSLLDLYGLIAMQIVVTRDPGLISSLRELADAERDPIRRDLLSLALEHA